MKNENWLNQESASSPVGLISVYRNLAEPSGPVQFLN